MSNHASTEDKAQMSRQHPRKHGIACSGMTKKVYETFVHLIPKTCLAPYTNSYSL